MAVQLRVKDRLQGAQNFPTWKERITRILDVSDAQEHIDSRKVAPIDPIELVAWKEIEFLEKKREILKPVLERSEAKRDMKNKDVKHSKNDVVIYFSVLYSAAYCKRYSCVVIGRDFECTVQPQLNIKGKFTWYKSSGELKLRDLQQQ